MFLETVKAKEWASPADICKQTPFKDTFCGDIMFEWYPKAPLSLQPHE